MLTGLLVAACAGVLVTILWAVAYASERADIDGATAALVLGLLVIHAGWSFKPRARGKQ